MVSGVRVETVSEPRMQTSVLAMRIFAGTAALGVLVGLFYFAMVHFNKRRLAYRAYKPVSTGGIEVDGLERGAADDADEAETLIGSAGQHDALDKSYGSGADVTEDDEPVAV